MPARQPNIVFITTDQQRGDCLGCMDSAVQTPNLDALAAGGIRFDEACTVSPLCMPARASWITGRYPHNHGVRGNRGCVLPEEQARTWAWGLKKQGYHTAFVGKHHFFNFVREVDTRDYDDGVRAFGFDDVHQVSGKGASAKHECEYTAHLDRKGLREQQRQAYLNLGGMPDSMRMLAKIARPAPVPENDHIDAYTGRQGVEWLEDYPGNAPFCLWLSFPGPHSPFDGNGRFADMYDPGDIELSPAFFDEVAAKPAYQKSRQITDPSDEESRRLAKRAKALYFANMSMIDAWIGRVMDVLKRREWFENTVVIFSSDHGEMLGDHGAYSKSLFYQGSVRVPFIMHWPAGIEGGRVSDAFVETVDLYRTIAEIAGLDDVPDTVCGHSLLPVTRGEKTSVRDTLFSELGGNRVMLRQGTWKLVYNPDTCGAEELYNLDEDPYELANRVTDPDTSGIRQDLQRALLDKLLRTRAPLRLDPIQTGIRARSACPAMPTAGSGRSLR